MKLQKENIALKIGSVVVNPSNSVRDLGVFLDNELTLRSHINKISSACFYHLRRLWQLRRLVDRAMMQRLVSAFVISKLDYCNSTLAGLPACALEQLQRVLHTAVRLVAGLGSRDRIRESTKDLHWLPIAHHIKFKLCILMHGVIFDRSPSYMRDLLVPVFEMQGRQRLRSAAGLYDVPFTRTRFGFSRWLPFGVEQSSSQYQTDHDIRQLKEH